MSESVCVAVGTGWEIRRDPADPEGGIFLVLSAFTAVELPDGGARRLTLHLPEGMWAELQAAATPDLDSPSVSGAHDVAGLPALESVVRRYVRWCLPEGGPDAPQHAWIDAAHQGRRYRVAFSRAVAAYSTARHSSISVREAWSCESTHDAPIRPPARLAATGLEEILRMVRDAGGTVLSSGSEEGQVSVALESVHMPGTGPGPPR